MSNVTTHQKKSSNHDNQANHGSDKIPNLRFPGFEGAWSVIRLGNETKKIGSGVTPRGGSKVYKDKGVLFIRSQNVNHDRLNLDDVTYIPEETHEHMRGSEVHPSDILLNITGASIGRSCVVPHDFKTGNVNQHVCIIRLINDQLPKFYQAFLSSSKGRKLVSQGQAGGGREGLNFQSIRSFKITIPSLPEQKKIASFLSVVDQKIQQLTRKKELLELYKKGVMQKIFPPVGGQAPEIRFRDENGNDYPDWEEKRLGGFAIKKSSNVAANTLEESNGDYPIYGASGYIKGVDFYNEENEYVAMVKDGAGVGRNFLCPKKSSVLGTMDIIMTKPGHSIHFLYYILQQIRFLKYIIGSTIPHIYFKDYSNDRIIVPCIDEQKRISIFLDLIQNNIESIQTQINQTQKFKTGLLQQMFV